MNLTKTSCISLMIGLLTALTSATQAYGSSLSETSISHYKRANAHVKRGNHRQAVAEYKQAYRLAPESTVGKYSLRALAYYGLSANEVGVSKQASSFQKQAEKLKLKSLEDAKNRINSRANSINYELKKIEDDERASIENIRNNPSYMTQVVGHNVGFNPYHRRYYRSGFGTLVRTVDPVATQARIDAVKAQAKERKARITDFSNKKNNQLIATHNKRSQMLDEMAENMHSQMFGKGVKLNPNGSNLYVRTYQ